MDLRYLFNKQPIAEGERSVLYQGGKLYVRTSLKAASVDDPAAQSVTYTLREVYDASAVTPPAPVNHAPVAGDTSAIADLEASQ